MVPSVYLKRHKNKIVGDEISKFYMPIQIAILYLVVFSVFIGYFVPQTLFLFYISIAILFLSYVIHALSLSKNFEDFVLFLCLFSVRNIAWNVGVTIGILNIKRD
jgi:fatty-acid desaturase